MSAKYENDVKICQILTFKGILFKDTELCLSLY